MVSEAKGELCGRIPRDIEALGVVPASLIAVRGRERHEHPRTGESTDAPTGVSAITTRRKPWSGVSRLLPPWSTLPSLPHDLRAADTFPHTFVHIPKRAKIPCSIARSLIVAGDWWSGLIIGGCFFGTRRFDEFQQRLNIAPNIISRRLRLIELGALTKVQYQTPRAHRSG
jgi:hypothetical protein